MLTIQAWQHIYSNVEQEQSPHRRGGFQTLFYTTAGLTAAEVEEMESRLLYFPSEVEPVKRLFFVTTTGKGVVAQIVGLTDPDRFGRKGRYLAHSLVFAPETLTHFEADPFRLFHHFSFITTVSEALSRGNFATGDIPAVTLSLPAEPGPRLEAARGWSPPELIHLALLALRVDRQADQRQAITLTGSPAQIESALETAWLVTPLALRPRCTFDTYFYRCNLVATYFWAIGLPQPPAALKFALVDGAAKRVQGTGLMQPETAYERWAAAVITAGQLPELAQQRDRAFALAEWLEGREYEVSRLEAAPPELIEAMFTANPAGVHASLRRRVGEQIPPPLAERAANRLYRDTPSLLALYRQLRQGYTGPQLLEVLYADYAAESFKEPPGPELKALETVLAQTNHPGLRLWLAYWQDPRRQLPRALEQADENAYRRFGERALRLKLVKPFSLLLPGRVDAFIDLYLAAGPENIVDLAETLLELKQPAALSRLAGYIPNLPAKDLKHLLKLVKNQPGLPESFQAAIAQAAAALPPEGGFWQSLWRRGRER